MIETKEYKDADGKVIIPSIKIVKAEKDDTKPAENKAVEGAAFDPKSLIKSYEVKLEPTGGKDALADDEWVCPNCGGITNIKFCPGCGTRRPEK